MRENTFFISCNCGCGNALECKTIDDIVYVSFLSGDFYIRQGVFNNIRERFKMLFGKHLLKDIIVDEKDLINFRDFLLSVPCENDEIVDNDSFIHIDYEKEFGEFGIWLISTLSDKDILLGRIHRPYEIALNKKERDILIKKINYRLKQHNKRKENKNE